MYFKYYIIFLCVMSLIAFIAYGIDKKKAKKKVWRIKEKTLILIMWLGGAYGGLMGMICFHHKTQKWYFWLNGISAFLLHTGAVLYTYIKYVK